MHRYQESITAAQSMGLQFYRRPTVPRTESINFWES